MSKYGTAIPSILLAIILAPVTAAQEQRFVLESPDSDGAIISIVDAEGAVLGTIPIKTSEEHETELAQGSYRMIRYARQVSIAPGGEYYLLQQHEWSWTEERGSFFHENIGEYITPGDQGKITVRIVDVHEQVVLDKELEQAVQETIEFSPSGRVLYAGGFFFDTQLELLVRIPIALESSFNTVFYEDDTIALTVGNKWNTDPAIDLRGYYPVLFLADLEEGSCRVLEVKEPGKYWHDEWSLAESGTEIVHVPTGDRYPTESFTDGESF